MHHLHTVLAIAACIACTAPAKPAPTGATCPDPNNPPQTWQTFGYDFFCHYCTNCHDSSLTTSQARNGAPYGHDFDTLAGVMGPWDHIDELAGWGPKAHNSFMPGGADGGRCPSMLGGELDEDCPEPTNQERTDLATFIACERERPQDYQGSAVSDHCAAYTGPH